jgi:hypothetical protein
MKRKYTRLAPKVKTKVSVQNRLRYVAVAGAFALGVFTVSLLYNTLGDSEKSMANNRVNGMETLAEFKHRKQLNIDIDAIAGNSDLLDFPVMLSIKDEDLRSASNGGKVVSDKGADIRFTKADGVTLLDYEIENYNPITGELVAWVRMDTLSKKLSKSVFLYFNNKYALDETTQSTWNKTYKGVWHLKGALSSKIPFASQFAQSVTEDKSKDIYVASEKNSSQFPCLNTPEDVDITGEITVSAWVNLNSNKESVIVSNQSGFNGGYRLAVNKKHKLEFEVRNENAEPAGVIGEEGGMELQKDTWYHVAAVYSDGGDSMVTYINGKRDRSIHTELSMAGSTEPLQIGREPSRKIYYFGGQIDEVRISNMVRNENWIATEFASLKPPFSFFKVGKTEAIQQQISMSLLTFDAEVQGASVELTWLTAMEIDNEMFTIERSINGTNYETIGTKPGAGNSSDLITYKWRDSKPAIGRNYYRIKLTDSRGNEEFSMITPANIEAVGEETINIASAQPNPFLKDFTVEYFVPKDGSAKVKLMSIEGDVLFEEQVNCEKSKPQHFFYKDAQAMKPGVYFLSVAQNDDKKMVKLIKRL